MSACHGLGIWPLSCKDTEPARTERKEPGERCRLHFTPPQRHRNPTAAPLAALPRGWQRGRPGGRYGVVGRVTVGSGRSRPTPPRPRGACGRTWGGSVAAAPGCTVVVVVVVGTVAGSKWKA